MRQRRCALRNSAERTGKATRKVALLRSRPSQRPDPYGTGRSTRPGVTDRRIPGRRTLITNNQHQRRRSAGQSLAEFALILPLMFVIFVAVIDLARVYTTILSVESAAREAADWGSWQSSNWIGDESDPLSNRAKTVAGMVEHACTAASNTPDYEEPPGTVDHETCTNPSFEYALVDDLGVDVTNDPTCADAGREPPCRVKVTLTHAFDLMIPLSISVRDVEIGFPSQLTVIRDSVFAMSDLKIPGAPSTATPAPTP